MRQVHLFLVHLKGEDPDEVEVYEDAWDDGVREANEKGYQEALRELEASQEYDYVLPFTITYDPEPLLDHMYSQVQITGDAEPCR